MEEFEFTWEHKLGRHDLVLDALSRRCTKMLTGFSCVITDFLPCLGRKVKETQRTNLQRKILDGKPRGTRWRTTSCTLREASYSCPDMRKDLLRKTYDSKWEAIQGKRGPCVAKLKLFSTQYGRGRLGVHLVLSRMLARQYREEKTNWITSTVFYSRQIVEECYHGLQTRLRESPRHEFSLWWWLTDSRSTLSLYPV